MMMIDFPYATTLAAAIGAFALGLIWYHPKVMGGRWMHLHGKKGEDIQPRPLPFILSLILWVIAACFYSFLVDLLKVGTPAELISLACLVWVAFAMPPTVMGALYTGTPFELVAIDTAYQLGGYYIFALVHILIGFSAGG